MTETKITESIVGIISAGLFLWLFPLASRIDAGIIALYSENASNYPLIISAGTLVFCSAIFGLIALYCLGECLEKIVLTLINRNKVK